MAALDEHAGVRFTSDIARDAQTSKQNTPSGVT